MRFRCLTCGGIYRSPLADGMEYFHACPPLSDAELRRAGVPEQGLESADRTRSGARDQNLIFDGPNLRGRVKSEGLGQTEVPEPGGIVR